MKDILRGLLQYLPQILQILPSVARFLPAIIIVVLISASVYWFAINYKDPYKCVDNEIYEQIRWDSNVYKFKGGYCI